MEQSSKNEQMKYDQRILFLLSCTAEIRPILQEKNLLSEKGVLIYAENKENLDWAVQTLKIGGAVSCRRMSESKKLWNNMIALHTYSRTDKAEEMEGYLLSEHFLPIITAVNMIPPDLTKFSNLLVVASCEDTGEDYRENLSWFQERVRCNPAEAEKALDLLRSSKKIKTLFQLPEFTMTLMATMEVFCYYYRFEHTESETEIVQNRFRVAIENQTRMAESFENSLDILEVVRKAIFDWIDQNPEVQIREYDNIDGEAMKALEEDRIIVYDSACYYFPEALLRKACQPLLDTVSFTTIKAGLYEKGILIANAGATFTYTIKKVLMTVYGAPLRNRFIKLRRDFFISVTSIGLEYRRENACMLEPLN